MGAAVSKSVSVIDIVNQSLTSVLLESSMNCTAQQSSIQQMTFSDLQFENCDVNFQDINQNANLTLNLSCAQETTNESDLQNKFSNKLDQELESTIKGLTIGFSSSETSAITNMKNIIKNEINVRNIANCVSSVLAEQQISFNKITAKCLPGQKINFKDINQVIVINNVSSCVQQNSNATNAINEIQNTIDNKLKSSVSGIDPLASLASSFVILIPLVLFFILPIIFPKNTSSNIFLPLISFIIVIAALIFYFFYYNKQD